MIATSELHPLLLHVKINLVFFKVLVLKYIHEYHRITRQKNGKPGP